MITISKVTTLDEEGNILKTEWHWTPAWCWTHGMDFRCDINGPFNSEEEAQEDSLKEITKDII